MEKLPSLHDYLLISYAVNCDAHQIRLRARSEAWAGSKERTILFDEVEAYSFKNDAFGNVISELREVPLDRVLREHGSEMTKAYRQAGACPWADNLSSASEVLAAKGVKGFELSASYGLSGWVLAKHAAVVEGD
jgi:hypothetical protein